MAGRGDDREESLASMIPVYCTLAIGVDLGDGRGPEAEVARLIVVAVRFFLGDLPGRFVEVLNLVQERPVDVDLALLGFRRFRGLGHLLRLRELQIFELLLRL